MNNTEKASAKIGLGSILFVILLYCYIAILPGSTFAQEEPPPPIPTPSICTPQDSGDNTSRPLECQLCNQTTLLEADCATSPTIKDRVSHPRGEGNTEAPHCLERSWGGNVTLDPTQVTIPFVGKKGQEDEVKYLADYFEGTNEYYRNYSVYWLDWVDRAGVLRKLTPMEYQNQLKKQMVERAQTSLASGNALSEGKIHDYKVKYVGRLCWDVPVLFDLLLAVARRLNISIDFMNKQTHYCLYEDRSIWESGQIRIYQAVFDAFNLISPFKISYQYTESVGAKFFPWDKEYQLSELDGHFPPDPNDLDYEKKWQVWKNSDGGKWFRLWQATPMVTREDTPGEILPYFGWRPRDNPKEIPPEVEKVPHVARLYEASQKITQILFPFGGERGTSQRREIPTPAPPPEGTCGLAGPIPVPSCNQTAISDSNPNDKLCCEANIRVNLMAIDTFENPDYESCRAEGIQCGDPYPCPIPPTYQCRDCHDPCNDVIEREVQRQFGLNLLHPYLFEIWNQTANAQTAGAFNSFRPASIPKFPDIEAASPIEYSYSGTGAIEPNKGQFYFNHLGGVQLAKEWTIRALTPWKE